MTRIAVKWKAPLEGTASEHEEAAPPFVEIIRDAAAAAAALKPPRPAILAALRQPASASALAQRLGLPRQRLSHHIRELENVGLVRLVERRRRRGCVELVVQATARRYLLSPDLLGETDPQEPEDLLRLGRLGWLPLAAIAGQAISETPHLRLTASSDSAILGGNETRANIHSTRGGATTRYFLATNSTEAPMASRGRPRETFPRAGSIASFLEAAGVAALELAGKILVRR